MIHDDICRLPRQLHSGSFYSAAETLLPYAGSLLRVQQDTEDAPGLMGAPLLSELRDL